MKEEKPTFEIDIYTQKVLTTIFERK